MSAAVVFDPRPRLRITQRVIRQARKARDVGKGLWAFDRAGVRYYGPDRLRLVARVIRHDWHDCESYAWDAMFGPCVWIKDP
jgi:hypothetical protein